MHTCTHTDIYLSSTDYATSYVAKHVVCPVAAVLSFPRGLPPKSKKEAKQHQKEVERLLKKVEKRGLSVA